MLKLNWPERHICTRCPMRYLGVGCSAHRCICGADLVRDPLDALDELLASPAPLEEQVELLKALLGAKGP